MPPSSNKKKKKKGSKKDGEVAARLQSAEEEAARQLRQQEEDDLAMAMRIQHEEAMANVEAFNRAPHQEHQLSFFGKTRPEALTDDELRTVMLQADVECEDCGDDRAKLVERCEHAWRSLEARFSSSVAHQPQPPLSSSPWPKSVDEVLATASRRTSTPVENEFLPWSFTHEFRVDDEELESLKGTYSEFLARFANARRTFDDLLNESHWSAFVLLTFLEYPFLVFCARKFVHTSKKNAPQLKAMTGFAQFPLAVVVERVAQWRRLMAWCRNVLKSSSSSNSTPDAVVAACLRLLACAAVGTTKPRPTVAKRVLEIEDDDSLLRTKAACQRLATDVARIFASRSLGPVNELYATQVPLLALASVASNLVGRVEVLATPFEKDHFGQALARVGDLFDDAFHDELARHLLHARDDPALFLRGGALHEAADDDEKKADDVVLQDGQDDDAATTDEWGRSTVASTRKCDNEGCDGVGTKRCACRLVSYCSKECQAADWPRHRPLCRLTAKKKKKSTR